MLFHQCQAPISYENEVEALQAVSQRLQHATHEIMSVEIHETNQENWRYRMACVYHQGRRDVITCLFSRLDHYLEYIQGLMEPSQQDLIEKKVDQDDPYILQWKKFQQTALDSMQTNINRHQIDQLVQ